MMNRKNFIGLVAGAFCLSMSAWKKASARAQYTYLPEDREIEELPLPTLAQLRQLAGSIPGDFPQSIRVTKVADTIRSAALVVAEADPDKKMTLARTVYQVVYDDGHIMLDSGMDLETHRTFGKTEEPYYAPQYAEVQQALTNARLIVFTHYHADHTAGVIRANNFDQLAPKVWLTPDTLDLLVNQPHKETVKIAAKKTKNFIVCDFKLCYPLAPGMVIFKTPGHTPDSKMLYIQLQDGREYIHSVDSGWSMENIKQVKMKAAPWVKENHAQLYAQYRWLNQLMAEYPELIVICTHDNEQFNAFREAGVLGSSLVLS